MVCLSRIVYCSSLTNAPKDATEPTFPFMILQDLFETQTIASCAHIFTYIETRTPRLTKGMSPQKGKALILLRMLNDLLRRLSKIGGTTIFCGRILNLLSAVFPLEEKSGVNLRGEYGPAWEGPGVKGKDKEVEAQVEKKEPGDDVRMPDAPKEKTVKEEDKMEVDDTSKRPSPKLVDQDKKKGQWSFPT